LTHPSTSKNNNNDKISQQKQKKLAKIAVGVVVPILLSLAIILELGIFDEEEFEIPRLYTFPDKMLTPNEITQSTNLFNLGNTLENEIALVEDIFSKVNLRCVNVNWYGQDTSKKQIYYNESVFEIQIMIKELELNEDEMLENTFIEFINNPLTQIFVEVNCPHVKNVFEIPDKFDPNFKGMTAFFACNTHPFFFDKVYCNYLPKQSLTT